MKYKLVQYVENTGFIVTEFADQDSLLAGAEIRGFKFSGLSKVYPADQKGAIPRAELQGQPKLSGVCGPMWDGDRDGPSIRYECPKAYQKLSA